MHQECPTGGTAAYNADVPNKTPYIQKATFSEEEMENVKKVLYCILIIIHVTCFRTISCVVLLLILSNGTMFSVTQIT